MIKAHTSLLIFTALGLFFLFCGGLVTTYLASDMYSMLSVFGLVTFIVSWKVRTPRPIMTRANKIWLILCFGFWLSAVLSWVINGFDEQQAKSLSSPYGKILLFPLTLFLFQFVFKDFRLLEKLLFFLLVSAVSVSALLAMDSRWGLFGFIPVMYRIQFGVNPIYYGDVSLCMGYACGFFAIRWVNEKQYLLTFIALTAFVLGVIASILSLSRGGWVSYPVILLAFLYYLVKLNMNKVVVMFVIGVCCSVFLLSMTDNPVKQRAIVAYQQFQSFDEKQGRTSIGYRLRMWDKAVSDIQIKPVFGQGPMSYHFDDLNDRDQLVIRYDHAHNGYLQALTTMGVVGLITYLSMFLYPMFYFISSALKYKDKTLHTSIMGVGVIFSYMIFDLTDVIFYRSVGLIYFLIITSLIMVLLEKEVQEKS